MNGLCALCNTMVRLRHTKTCQRNNAFCVISFDLCLSKVDWREERAFLIRRSAKAFILRVEGWHCPKRGRKERARGEEKREKGNLSVDDIAYSPRSFST